MEILGEFYRGKWGNLQGFFDIFGEKMRRKRMQGKFALLDFLWKTGEMEQTDEFYIENNKNYRINWEIFT